MKSTNRAERYGTDELDPAIRDLQAKRLTNQGRVYSTVFADDDVCPRRTVTIGRLLQPCVNTGSTMLCARVCVRVVRVSCVHVLLSFPPSIPLIPTPVCFLIYIF